MSTNRPASFQLSLLGGWRLSIDGRDVGPDYDKGRALLAYLAMEPRWHSRDWLAALFWPDADNPRANLRQVLANLRAALGDNSASTPCLLVERNAVRFNPAWENALDVTAFKAGVPSCSEPPTATPFPTPCKSCIGDIESLAGCYTGEFLAGFSLPDCSEFENWCQFQRESLHRHALSLLARLVDCHTRAGNTGRAIHFTLRYLALEPWDEAQQRRLMHLHVHAGQALAAIQHYEAFARLLQAEMGVRPEEATQQLYEHLRAGRLSHSSHLSQASPLPAPPPVAERRQVTVLYCELNAPGDDPEEILDHLSSSQGRVTELIRQQGGHLVQAHGGGLLVYFGYPYAQEDAARRALHAAFSIARSLQAPVRGRFGIHTGLIVTGDDPAVPDAIGETSRLAIKLRRLGGDPANDHPGSDFNSKGKIIVSRSTQRLSAGFFHFKNLGQHLLPDISTPQEAFLALGETGAGTRLEAIAQLSPFIGREGELAELAAGWQRTISSGRLHAVLLRGDAGIGKSRLLWQFKASIAATPMQLREFHCRPEYANTALHPISESLGHSIGFAPGDSDNTRLDKMEAHLAKHFPNTPADTGQLLAQLLCRSATRRYGPTALAPAQEKERLFALLQQLVFHLADQAPLLLVVEDLHWADPSTLALASQLLDTAPPHPILLVFTARPEFHAAWEVQTQQISLAPLAAPDASRLIDMLGDALGQGQAVTEHTAQRILQGSDGVPLFIEEMTQLVCTDGNHEPRSSIPSTLHDLLMARLDQLGEARQLAQLAAVIGREFDDKTLFLISPHDKPRSSLLLAQLTASGLVQQLDTALAHRHQFKHALIRDAAYQSLSRQARRAAHRRIAQILLAAGEAGEEAPEVLARHFLAADLPREACAWWLRAGSEAATRCAYAEAILHFQQALTVIMGLPEDQERDALELQVQVKLGYVLLATQGYGSLAASQAYDRALALGERTGASLELFLAFWGLYLGASSRTHHSDAMQLAERMLAMAQQVGSPEQLIAAHYACTNSAYSLGRFALARQHAAQAKRHYQPELDTRLVSLFGEHVGLTALFFDAWSLWALDAPDQARQTVQEGLTLARRIGHPQTLCLAHCFAGVLYRLLDEPAEVAACGTELSHLAARHGLAFWQAVGELFLGWAQTATGDPAGITRISAALAAIRAGVFIGAVMYFLEMLAEAHAMLGQYREQLQVIDEALEIMTRIHDAHAAAEYYRLKGECLLRLGHPPAEARHWLDRALSIAQQQGATLLEKRAAASLVKLGVAGAV